MWIVLSFMTHMSLTVELREENNFVTVKIASPGQGCHETDERTVFKGPDNSPHLDLALLKRLWNGHPSLAMIDPLANADESPGLSVMQQEADPRTSILLVHAVVTGSLPFS
ncbi:hypothetical protein ElyMa_005877000 [Elysia marginata]|uniref:Uncharacterized protein n=1 Tax=Elysia marginata TaxID=1093978 RepID=A0AAV4G3I0_9GAST|nr:hypothetical protein ElyMa_005877000 [Elysia marginata]